MKKILFILFLVSCLLPVKAIDSYFVGNVVFKSKNGADTFRIYPLNGKIYLIADNPININKGVTFQDTIVTDSIRLTDGTWISAYTLSQLGGVYLNDSNLLKTAAREWNASLAKQITADDTTWWGQSTDTTNISLRIDSCLKVADSTDYITSHAFNTDTVTASNTGTVPVYRYNYWNSKQNALTNPVTSESESYSSGRLPYFNGTTNTITGSNKATLTGLGGNAVLLIAGGSSSGNYMGFTAQINDGNGSHFRYYHASGAPRATLLGSTVITTIKGGFYSGVVLTDASKDYFKVYVNDATTIGFEVPLGRSMLWASTIGRNTTNDKKWSANADYRAIWQNYSGGDYGDSVSISNAGVINVPIGGNYYINSAKLNATNVDTSHNSTGIATYNDVLSQAGKDSIYDFNNGYIIPHNWSNSYMPTTYRRFNWFNGFGANPNNVSTNGIFYNGWFQASRIMSHLNKPLDYAAYFQQDGNGGTLQLYNLGTGHYINGISGGTVEFYVDGSGRGYFSGGIKADANDTIFFGSDYLTGTGSGELRTESDISVGSAEVNGDLEAVGYYIGNNEVIKESEISNSLAINGHGDYDNVRIAADTLFLNHDLFTYGLSTTLTQHVAHLEAKDSTTTIANTGTYYILRKWRTDTAGTVTVTDSTIKIDVSGFYYVYLNSSFSGINNATIECDLFINDVINDGSFGFKRKLSTGGDVGAASFSGVRYFNVNDILKVRVKSDVTGTLTAGRKNFGCFRLN